MNMQQKIDTVYQWLKEGYTVHGVKSGKMWIDGKYIRYLHFGSSAMTVSKKSVHFLLTKIFNDVSDFYIIDEEDLMQCTDKMTAFYCNGIGSDFTFYDRDRENKLFVYADTITQMIINMQSIAEKHTKQYTDDNVVRFKVTRKISPEADRDFIEHTKFFNNWTFAV